ncbi:MAG TPA: hypothetical protein VHA79_09220 [Mycobacteriales bacterium]|nr:hypothetical protein [Mycobacteriales bacterium]
MDCMADEPSEDDREQGRLYDVRRDAGSTLPQGPANIATAPVEDKPTLSPTSSPPKAGKRDSVAYFSVRIAPATDPTLIANDLKARFADPEATMHALNVWQAEDGRVAVLMRYHAKGANSNDISRRIMSATPVGKSQVEIVSALSADLEVDADELLTCIGDLEGFAR